MGTPEGGVDVKIHEKPAKAEPLLPAPAEVQTWTPEQFTAVLRHDQADPAFSVHVRQLLHVGYKIAGSMGARYTDLLEACEPSIARTVTANLYERHIVPLFIGR